MRAERDPWGHWGDGERLHAARIEHAGARLCTVMSDIAKATPRRCPPVPQPRSAGMGVVGWRSTWVELNAMFCLRNLLLTVPY